MRYSIAASALLAASSLAKPILQQRDVVVATAVETVLKTVWVDATGPSPTAVPTHSVFSAPQKDVKKVTSEAPVPVSSSVVVVSTPSTSAEAIVESSAPAPSAPAAPSTSSSSGASGSLQDVAVSGHNQLRSQHSASPLTWSDDLAASAQALAETCVFGHNVDLGPASSYGQNIASSSGTLSLHDAATELSGVISDSWYQQESETFAELGLYGVSNPIGNDFGAWGHFTQEVWASTTQVGCAVVACNNSGYNGVNNGYFTVCNYNPAGNYAGQFASNVLQ